MAEELLIHANCVCVGELGFLLLGPPGSGKSDLTLRLIDQAGGGLSGTQKISLVVADDQVLVRRQGSSLFARPPLPLAGLLEVRGLGPVRVSHRAEVKLAAAVRLVPSSKIERLPDPEARRQVILGVALPLFDIDPKQASAQARVRAAADWLKPL